MKKFIYCALIALVAISCDQDSWDNPYDIPIIIPNSFYAQAPIPDVSTRSVSECQTESWDDSVTVNTRTYAVVDPDNASEYFQYWSEGDAISLFFTTRNLQYVMQSYKDGTQDIGKFELVGNAAKGSKISTGYYYSVYPYKAKTTITTKGVVTYTFPETQHYSGDSYANGENGMIAIEPMVGTDSVLYFQNFCSYLQLRLVAEEGESKTVKKITLTTNKKEDRIAGTSTIEIKDENSAPIVKMNQSATNQITLDCGSGVELSQDLDNPTKFWFVLPGGFSFTEGFSVTVIFSDYSYFKKSTTKEIGIERSHIKPMAPFKPTDIKLATGPIRYKYNSGKEEEPFPLKNTFYGEDGSVLDIVDQIYEEKTGEWVVLLSGTLKYIGDNSFEGPGKDIEYIKVDNDDESIIVNNFAFYNCTADSLIIRNNVDEINESAFTGSTIKDLNIYGNVTTIKNSAGTGSSIENINITGSVEVIDEEAFNSCGKLKNINIGTVETVGSKAFSGCSNLLTVNIGNVESIEYRAFFMCSNLTQVSIPGVKYLGMGAFRSCTSLETIDLGSVITIDDNAFMDCTSLAEVIISENCTMIGEGAFCNAVNLQNVYCYAVYPPFIKTDNDVSSYAFDNVREDICIHIPMGSWDYYLDAEYFINNSHQDPNIKAKVNWWADEYYYMLVEMEVELAVEN